MSSLPTDIVVFILMYTLIIYHLIIRKIGKKKRNDVIVRIISLIVSVFM